jgi:hypothetical protein
MPRGFKSGGAARSVAAQVHPAAGSRKTVRSTPPKARTIPTKSGVKGAHPAVSGGPKRFAPPSA